MAEHAHAAEHTHPNYVKIWAILVVLLVVSVAGPMIGIKIVTLITAFGIAIVKAYLVAKNFMHINVEKRFVPFLVVTALVFMLLFFAGTAPDVMKKEGRQLGEARAGRAARRRAPRRRHEGAGAPLGREVRSVTSRSGTLAPGRRIRAAARSSRTACSACCSSSPPRPCCSRG